MSHINEKVSENYTSKKTYIIFLPPKKKAHFLAGFLSNNMGKLESLVEAGHIDGPLMKQTAAAAVEGRAIRTNMLAPLFVWYRILMLGNAT